MVKGISRQVIVVRPPNQELFEQAIFILKDKASETGGVTDEEILLQARRAADDYLRARVRGGRARGMRLRPMLYALLGALTTSVLWVLSALVF